MFSPEGQRPQRWASVHSVTCLVRLASRVLPRACLAWIYTHTITTNVSLLYTALSPGPKATKYFLKGASFMRILYRITNIRMDMRSVYPVQMLVRTCRSVVAQKFIPIPMAVVATNAEANMHFAAKLKSEPP